MNTENKTSTASHQASAETTDAPPEYNELPEAIPDIRADTVNATGIILRKSLNFQIANTVIRRWKDKCQS